eukprot:UN11143
MKQGCIVIWNQTCPHGSDSNRSAKIRAAQFVKAFPKHYLTKEQRKSRRKLLRST